SGASQSFTLIVSGGANAVLTPNSINFGNVTLFGVGAAKVMLQNTGTKALTISGISITPGTDADRYDFFYLSFCGSTVAAGKSCPIYVFYYADDLGTATATLNVADNAPGGV